MKEHKQQLKKIVKWFFSKKNNDHKQNIVPFRAQNFAFENIMIHKLNLPKTLRKIIFFGLLFRLTWLNLSILRFQI